MPISTSVFAFSVACLVTLLVTPIVRRLAVTLRWRDRPVGAAHKARGASRSQAGGLAVLAACAIALWSLDAAFGNVGPRLHPLLIAIGPGALLVTGVGLLDDLRGCRPLEKILVHLAAVSVLVSSEAVLVWGDMSGSFGLPLIAAVAGLGLFIVTMTNAMNLIDGIDGLAPGLAVLAGAGLSILAVRAGDLGAAALSATVTGAALGFLRSNRHPAKLYLGDSGSTLLGFLIAATGVNLLVRNPSFEMLLGLILCCWIPLLDTGLAVVRRLASGVSPFRPDRDHVHHRLLAAGLSISRASLVLWLVALVGVVGGVRVVAGDAAWIWSIAVIAATLPLARVVLPLRVTTSADDLRVREREPRGAEGRVVHAAQNRAA